LVYGGANDSAETRMKLEMTLRPLTQPLLVLLLTAASSAAGLLDGTVWNVQAVPTINTEEKGVARFDDVLTFSQGRMSSKKLQAQGIGPVLYSAHGTYDFMNWETAPILREKRTAEWDGVTKEGNLTGNLKWVNDRGRVLYFFISGQRTDQRQAR
jgi:hypothetical protein